MLAADTVLPAQFPPLCASPTAGFFLTEHLIVLAATGQGRGSVQVLCCQLHPLHILLLIHQQVAVPAKEIPLVK